MAQTEGQGRGRHAAGRRRAAGRHGRRRAVNGRIVVVGASAGVLALVGGLFGLLGQHDGAPGGVVSAARQSEPSHGAPGGQAAADGAARPSGRAAAGEPRAEAQPSSGKREPQKKGEAPGAGARPPSGEPVQGTPAPEHQQAMTESGPGEVAAYVEDGAPEAGGRPETGGRSGYNAKGYKGDGPSPHTDRKAADYFRATWGAGDKANKRLKDIRTVGGYLRIYTDLPETADNSWQAIKLCERGVAYLRGMGVANPVVFVQAEFGENGNPVLANILGPSDKNCRVTYPAPN
ncbi:hypothetical protein HII36_04145 [Nonomuraea sp. NN258]|uniref:hypothetical protein n=1 Tax=Nonomuraea antri TaxID=2730852 RepID=UPI001567EECF|nr:hypothetical protein [Nonomuraea antri]NRQ31026.1 hypothetical protein [Nonomuraea antri]